MNLHKMIEICLKDDNMHRFVMINALICINIYVITCTNIMLSERRREGEGEGEEGEKFSPPHALMHVLVRRQASVGTKTLPWLNT